MRLALWMYEGTAHHGVGRIANSMQKVHAVFHAPQGDDYVNPIFTMLERTPAFPQMTTSVVSGRDLAQGTIRLPETLRQVEAKLHPELIVVCASCSTILLQEDLQTVADSARTQAEVLVYDANPYRMAEVLAADGLFSLLVRRYARPQPLTPRPSVNIIGPASLGFHVRTDVICLRRMLQTLGVQLNVVAPLGAGLGDLARLPAAWLNIAPYRELGHSAAGFLEEQFGTPALYDAPIGVQPTLAWLRRLVEQLNEVGARVDGPAVHMPPLTAFSLDGMSAPSGVPWFARTADMESFSSKRAFVFGDATHTVGMVKFLHDELGLEIAGAGTYLAHEAGWVRAQLAGYLPEAVGSGQAGGSQPDQTRQPAADSLLVTEKFQVVAAQIERLAPELVCGTQMERHSCRKLDIPCMVIAPPTHIENHLLGYRPMLGFDGADVIADEVYTTATLGMEKHLIDLFGDAGLEYEEASNLAQATGDTRHETADAPIEPTSLALPGLVSPAWAPEAQAMLKKVPFFVRGRVQKNVERYAAEQGQLLITAEVLQSAKEALGG
ncbi:MAG: ferredoxin:protochlorophyllide reductase (ATP-dependent) subunit B [Kouleothrix sp.]|jgi:light-independent protochlorophyllide reductase subunit B|nr:ferredoxin:protochlorophyllide reductase (ATP-dependent) subunit B [Kouleothrix sp.]